MEVTAVNTQDLNHCSPFSKPKYFAWLHLQLLVEVIVLTMFVDSVTT